MKRAEYLIHFLSFIEVFFTYLPEDKLCHSLLCIAVELLLLNFENINIFLDIHIH